jgi:hypothetical protein
VPAQTPTPASAPALTDANLAALRGIAEVALPTALDGPAREDVVTAFAVWIRNYREGADRGHGYGSSTLAQPTGPSPALRYPSQFEALDRAAAAQGAASFAALPRNARRAVVEAALNDPKPVQRLPTRPTGSNLVADFIGFYFTSDAAWNLAYRADIGRDRCRSLDGSDRPPAPIRTPAPASRTEDRGPRTEDREP